MKRLTEEESNEPDESSCELDESVQHMKGIKKIEETNKHYIETVKLNGVKKDIIFDTRS